MASNKGHLYGGVIYPLLPLLFLYSAPYLNKLVFNELVEFIALNHYTIENYTIKLAYLSDDI